MYSFCGFIGLVVIILIDLELMLVNAKPTPRDLIICGKALLIPLCKTVNYCASREIFFFTLLKLGRDIDILSLYRLYIYSNINSSY